MPDTTQLDALTTRIHALERQAKAVRDAFQTVPRKYEATTILDTLREADWRLRGQPSPDVITHVAKHVEEAGRRLYTLVREMD